MLKISANGTYGAIGDGTDANRYMSFNAGNVGIGRTGPQSKLDVLSSARITSAVNTSHSLKLEARSDFANDNDSSLIWISDGGSGSNPLFSGQGAHLVLEGRKSASRHIYFKVGDTTTARHIMHANGNVGIGRTDPSAILDIQNNTGSDTAADTMVRFDNARGSDWNVVIKNNNTSYGLDIRETPSSGYLIYGRVNGGGNTFIVNGNGNVKNANNSYGAISDLKLKENIIDATSQWEDIKALRIRKYSFKTDELDQPNQLGVIAQELETAGMGGLVNTVQDVDIDVVGKPLLDTYTKDVKYSVLYMKAVKALQEAMSRIEALETRLDNAE
jgi:hypothetical protein